MFRLKYSHLQAVQENKKSSTFTAVWVCFLELRNTVLLLYVIHFPFSFRNQPVDDYCSRNMQLIFLSSRGQLKCDGTHAETKFRLSAKRTSPFKSAGASVQSTTGSRGVRISGSNAGYTMFRGSVKSTGYPLHSPVSLSLPLPYVTVCHHISTGV